MNPDGTEFDELDELDELELLRRDARAIGMPGQVTPESVGIVPQTAEDILARIKARTAGPGHAEDDVVVELPKKRRRIAARVLALAAAAAGVVGLIVAPWQQPSATAGTPPVLDFEFANAQNIAYAPGEDARTTLLSLARTAAEQPPVSRNGPTQYQLSDNWFATLEATKAAELIPKRRESWLRADGSVRIREAAGTPLSPDGRGLTAKATGERRVTNETYPADEVSASLVSDLDGDYRKVRTAVMNSAQCVVRTPGPARTACLFQEIASLHDQFVVPPKVSSRFWEILAREPTLRLLGAVTDRAGRPGIGISLISVGSPQFRQVLIISPTTGQLLGTEVILIKDDPDVGVKAPAIYSFTAILESEYTTARGPKD
ncbi:CU044_5270 family protein [Aeromicrobium sp. P5_D10]